MKITASAKRNTPGIDQYPTAPEVPRGAVFSIAEHILHLAAADLSRTLGRKITISSIKLILGEPYDPYEALRPKPVEEPEEVTVDTHGSSEVAITSNTGTPGIELPELEREGKDE